MQDLFLEFTGPQLGLKIFAIGFLGDKWAFVVLNVVFSIWYGLDHDENLGLPHTDHHKYIDGDYFAYLSIREPHPELDKVRALIDHNSPSASVPRPVGSHDSKRE